MLTSWRCRYPLSALTLYHPQVQSFLCWAGLLRPMQERCRVSEPPNLTSIFVGGLCFSISSILEEHGHAHELSLLSGFRTSQVPVAHFWPQENCSRLALRAWSGVPKL